MGLLDAINLQDLIRSGITAAVTLGFGAFVTGSVGMFFWNRKRRRDKLDDKGPVLYKKEHDEVAEKKHDEMINKLDMLQENQTRNFGKISSDFSKVHERIDEGNAQFVSHLQAEAGRGRG